MFTYVFPPISLLPRVIGKLKRKLQNCADLPILAPPSMVHCETSETASGSSSNPPDSSWPTVPTTLTVSSPGTTRSPPSMLAIVKRAFHSAGLSEDAATLATKGHWLSTRQVYDSRIRHFTKWCDERRLDLLSASLADVTEFLLFLFRAKLAIGTVKNYRSAIEAIHKGFLDGTSISSNSAITHLLPGMFNERPPVRKLVPSWDLKQVLPSRLAIQSRFLRAVVTSWALFRGVPLMDITLWCTLTLLSAPTAARSSNYVNNVHSKSVTLTILYQ